MWQSGLTPRPWSRYLRRAALDLRCEDPYEAAIAALYADCVHDVLPVTDGFMVDLKALDPTVHARLTGRSNRLVLDSIRHLYRGGRLAEVRLLLVPGHNDSDDQLRRTGAWLAGIDPHLRVVVIGFRRHGVRPAFADTPEAGPELLAHAGEVLTGSGLRHVVVV